MSVQSNQGIILFANVGGTGGAQALVVGANTSITRNVQVASRLVLTVHMAYGGAGVTKYSIQVRLRNTNLFGTIANGSAPPVATGGSTDASFVATPLLSAAQNDNSPGTYTLSHDYTATTDDYIELSGALAGVIDVLVTVTGVPATTDSITIALDSF